MKNSKWIFISLAVIIIAGIIFVVYKRNVQAKAVGKPGYDSGSKPFIPPNIKMVWDNFKNKSLSLSDANASIAPDYMIDTPIMFGGYMLLQKTGSNTYKVVLQ